MTAGAGAMLQHAEQPQGDIDLFASIVVALGEIRERAELRRATIRLIPELVCTSLIAWNEVDRAAASMVFEMAPDRSREASSDAFLSNIGEHPVIAYYERTHDGRPWAISDFLDARSFHATRLYQQFYRLIDAEDQISLVVPEPRLLIGIALNRDRRGFSPRDRTLLNLLRPVIAQAYRNASEVERLDRILASVGNIAEQSGEGIVVLDGRGRPEFIGERSRDLLRHWFAEQSVAALPRPLEDWLHATRRRPGPTWPFVLERDGRRLVVRLLHSGTGEALLLSEPDTLDPSAVATQLGLTPRERQVMELVSQAVPTGEIAVRLRISRATAYKHIQNSLDKLGASNRMEAVNLLRQSG